MSGWAARQGFWLAPTGRQSQTGRLLVAHRKCFSEPGQIPTERFHGLFIMAASAEHIAAVAASRENVDATRAAANSNVRKGSGSECNQPHGAGAPGDQTPRRPTRGDGSNSPDAEGN